MTFNESVAGRAAETGEIFELSDQYILASAALDPLMATFWGVPGHDDEMTDFSPEGWARRLELQQQTCRKLAEVEPRGRHDRIAIEVMRERVELERDLIESGEYHRWLAVMNSPHEYVREIFDFMPRESEEDWTRIRARLAAVPDALEGLRTSFLYAADGGKVAARRQALACAESCEVWGRPDGAFGELATESETIDLDVEARGAAAAFREFGHWLRSDYAPIATPHDPVGPERYRLMARYHNGTDLDLDETYAWGWDELHGIEQRMTELADQIVPDSSLAECVERLKTDPRYVVEGVDNFLAWNQEIIDRTIADLHGRFFDIPEPLRRCQSMATPAGGPNTTYYTPPSEDFTRPGQIWHPVEGKTHFPLYEALSIAYHEGTPGHHLQLAQMMYQAQSLTRFQRLAFISGHGEGWALYAERLMHELGYLDDPVYELGWLVGQALRAARVILDIGLHCELRIPSNERFHPGERWRPELGVPFLVERTGCTTEYLASEVDRYLGIPGQAISYKVGERVFLEGRDRAKRRLGEWFNLKTFHQVVLDMGAMGLDQLRDELDALASPDFGAGQ
ncbi:MAG: DUF885 domain-containing protein [Ilumatobacteraceae bacterium]